MKLTKEKSELLMKMQYKSVVTHCLINGEKFEFNIDSRFSPVKTKELIDELVKYIAVTHDSVEVDNFNFTDVIFSLVLKYFTDVPLFDRSDVKEMDSHSTLKMIKNVAQVTESLATIICDNGESVLQFLNSKIDGDEIVKLQNAIGEMVIALTKFIDYRDESQKLLVQLEQYLESTISKIEQSSEISSKIEYLENGGERVFEKEVI